MQLSEGSVAKYNRVAVASGRKCFFTNLAKAAFYRRADGIQSPADPRPIYQHLRQVGSKRCRVTVFHSRKRSVPINADAKRATMCGAAQVGTDRTAAEIFPIIEILEEEENKRKEAT